MEKDKLKKVFISLINVGVALFEIHLSLVEKEKDKQPLKQLLKDCKKAVDIINGIEHVEILVGLYNSFVAQQETYFALLVKTVVKKDGKRNVINYWDKTKKGFEEFLRLEKEAISKTKEELEEKEAERKAIAKAQAQGKKVEFMLVDGKMKPIIKID